MTEQSRAQFLLHGAIVLLVGLLCGIRFGVGVGYGWSDETVRAWRVAHSGGVTVGLMLIAIGAVSDRLRLGEGAASILVWSLVVSAYSFSLGLVLAAAPAVNVVVFAAYMVGSLGVLLGVVLMIRGAYAALRKAKCA